MKRIISILLALSVMTVTALLSVVPFAATAVPTVLYVSNLDARTVISYGYRITQPTDLEGEPAGVPTLAPIVIRVVPLDDYDLLDWALDPTNVRDLDIKLVDPIDGRDYNSIRLSGAYCIGYTECWNADGTYYEEIELSVYSLANGSAQFIAEW